MKNFTSALSKLALGAALLFSVGTVNAQKVQFIHNAPDPKLDSIDIFIKVAGNVVVTLDDFKFRQATAFTAVPFPGITADILIAEGHTNSPDSAFLFKSVTLGAGNNYILMLQGVVDPQGFKPNPSGAAIDVKMLEKTSGRDGSTNANFFYFFTHFGIPDAPKLALSYVIPGQFTESLLANAAFGFGDTIPYFGFSPVNGWTLNTWETNGTQLTRRLFTHQLDFAGYGTKTGVLFYSGFLDPSSNKGGKAATLMLALNDGTVIELKRPADAKIQIINAIADPSVSSVDVYFDGVKVADDLAYKGATAYLTFKNVTSGTKRITLTKGTGASEGDSIYSRDWTISGNIGDRGYAMIARGVTDDSKFAFNPDGAPIVLGLGFVSTYTKSPYTPTNKPLAKIYHAVTDLGKVDIVNAGNTIFPNGGYTQYNSNYVTITAESNKYNFIINDPNTGNKLYSFRQDLNFYADSTAVVVLSGFKSPNFNQNGPPVDMFTVFPSGYVVTSINTTTVDENQVGDVTINTYPNPTNGLTTVYYTLDNAANVSYRLMDVTGKVVYSSENGNTFAGEHHFTFDAAGLASGMYTLQLQTDNKVSIRKIMVE